MKNVRPLFLRFHAKWRYFHKIWLPTKVGGQFFEIYPK